MHRLRNLQRRDPSKCQRVDSVGSYLRREESYQSKGESTKRRGRRWRSRQDLGLGTWTSGFLERRLPARAQAGVAIPFFFLQKAIVRPFAVHAARHASRSPLACPRLQVHPTSIPSQQDRAAKAHSLPSFTQYG